MFAAVNKFSTCILHSFPPVPPGDKKKKLWNAALRNDHNFPKGDKSKDTPRRVKFNDVDRFECYESATDPQRKNVETNGRRNRYIRMEIDRSRDLSRLVRGNSIVCLYRSS
eukprot:COSAG06_NODE_7548_length_2462_cov_230.721117_1_plen_111_part_00